MWKQGKKSLSLKVFVNFWKTLHTVFFEEYTKQVSEAKIQTKKLKLREEVT